MTPIVDEDAAPVVSPGWRLVIPAIVALLAVLALPAPRLTPLPIFPNLPLLVVGVWALYQPRLMPPLLALAIGFAADLVLGLPAGVHATLLPLLAFVLSRLDRRGVPQPFLADWAMAAGVLALYQLAAWQLAGLGGAPRPVDAYLPQAMATWLLFPAVTRASAWFYRRMTEVQ